jgi:translation initiation factor IF-3
LSRPQFRFQQSQPQHRINGRIRAREVRVIGPDGQQLGILDIGIALNLARQNGVDLVEIAPNAQPPVCRLVDYGKFRYEQAKKERESKKTQHATIVKEIQLTARIDPHDLGIKMDHAVEFLCEDHKLKVALRFRGREMAHTEIGKQVVEKFLKDLAPWGHPDSPPRLAGRTINVMVSPLPRNKRAANPKATGEAPPSVIHADDTPAQVVAARANNTGPVTVRPPRPRFGGAPGGPSRSRGPAAPARIPTNAAERPRDFGQAPFSSLEVPEVPKSEPSA